ncbi:hypothetical protein DN062_03585 [Nitrincola tibetensis]|uniref:Wadjet protein JetD C-terminal domain-containing protein n=2 Tax=Nitrincola tibetensis TaxID=2219697 RepID=A0A364NQK1_9GAMM|nr:hypothetical protein DN062_03585 [Nitrincola tibetensis]
MIMAAKNTRISTYLEKIDQSKPINYSVFDKLLAELGYSEHKRRSLFRVELVAPKSYRVHILDKKGFQELQLRHGDHNYSNRHFAALAGDSHRVSVSGACLLLRNQIEPHPQVVLFEGTEWHSKVVLSTSALLVENLENFLAFEKTLQLLPECGLKPNQPVDVLYAAGNQITHAILQPFLSRYSEINCLFDPDLGGIRMFRTLHQRMPKHSIRFLYPMDIEERLIASNRSLKSEDREGLVEYVGLSDEVDSLIQMLRKTKRSLEQETYLS